MAKKTLKIIGINPGTRYLGIAVLYGQELLDWRIKVLDGKWSAGKITKAIGIVFDLIERYKPNVLIIKKLHPARRSENLMRLAKKIKEFARRKGLKAYQYSIKEIEKIFIESAKMNKWNLIDVIIKLYPALHYDLTKERSHKNPYYFRAFEAVALAEVYSRR